MRILANYRQCCLGPCKVQSRFRSIVHRDRCSCRAIASHSYPIRPRAFHHFNISPYILGLSPRMYDSITRFSTVAQSRSRRSFSMLLSSLSFSLSTLCRCPPFTAAKCRFRLAFCSPSAKRGPRSGQFRAGSKGFHLYLVKCQNLRKEDVIGRSHTKNCGNDKNRHP